MIRCICGRSYEVEFKEVGEPVPDGPRHEDGTPVTQAHFQALQDRVVDRALAIMYARIAHDTLKAVLNKTRAEELKQERNAAEEERVRKKFMPVMPITNEARTIVDQNYMLFSQEKELGSLKVQLQDAKKLFEEAASKADWFRKENDRLLDCLGTREKS